MISVLIVDDDPFIRESLKLLVGMDPDIEVSAIAEHGEEALALLEEGLLSMSCSWTFACRYATAWRERGGFVNVTRMYECLC